MPAAKYIGSPGGSGNPPGKYSKGYVSMPGGQSGHFVNDKGYRGNMHAGRMDYAPVVGNQPKEHRYSTLESRVRKENPISQVGSYKGKI